MAAGRSLKSLMGRRRSMGDDDDDNDQASVLSGGSVSEGSVLTDAGGGAVDGDASCVGAPSTTGPGAAEADSVDSKVEVERKPQKQKKQKLKGPGKPQDETFKAVADTDAMMNGLKIEESAQSAEAIDFEKLGAEPAAPAAPTASNEQAGDRQRRDHEDYRKKRDADPAFIPNRGNFFMHDTRGQQNGQSLPPANMRGGWQNRGRGGGRGGFPLLAHSQQPPVPRQGENQWKHDLHDTINEHPPARTVVDRDQEASARLFPKQPPPAQPPRVLTFSTSTLVGAVTIRVLLPSTSKPARSFPDVPWKQHTRLPVHRPPLRRDKPVRVALPEKTARYIFPSVDRSFIFVPRATRPGQQGFNRARGSFGYAGHGPPQGYGYSFSSRRTSMHSHYASSIAASRRSSLAVIDPHIRMPSQARSSGHHTPVGYFAPPQQQMQMQMHTYPLPQQPIHQGILATSTLHQPRPQKAISVNDIEVPALLSQAPQEPFAEQLPPTYALPQAYAQPYAYQPQYYPPPMQPQQGYYYTPPYQPPYQPLPSYDPVPQVQEPASGMVARESNGMVFYVPAAEAGEGEGGVPAEGFVPTYALPGLATAMPQVEYGYGGGGYYGQGQ